MLKLIYQTDNHKLVGPRQHVLRTDINPVFVPRKGDLIVLDGTQYGIQRIRIELDGEDQIITVDLR